MWVVRVTIHSTELWKSIGDQKPNVLCRDPNLSSLSRPWICLGIILGRLVSAISSGAPRLKRTEKQNHLELFGAGRIPSLSYRVSNAHSLYEVSSTVATFGMLGASPLEFPRRDPCERLQWVHCWNWTFRLDVSWDSEDSYVTMNQIWSGNESKSINDKTSMPPKFKQPLFAFQTHHLFHVGRVVCRYQRSWGLFTTSIDHQWSGFVFASQFPSFFPIAAILAPV